MYSIRFLLGLSLSMILSACSAKHTESSDNAAASTADNSSIETHSQPTGVLTNAQQETLQKAKQVEGLLQETHEKNLKQIDDTTDGKE